MSFEASPLILSDRSCDCMARVLALGLVGLGFKTSGHAKDVIIGNLAAISMALGINSTERRVDPMSLFCDFGGSLEKS